MTGEDLRLTAANYLNRIFYKNAYHNILISKINTNPDLTSRDRAYLTETITGVVVLRKKLEWIISAYSTKPIKKLERNILTFLLIGVYNLLEDSYVPEHAAINEVVGAVKIRSSKRTAGFVNGILRTVQRESSNVCFPALKKDPVLSLSVRYSHPEWIVKRWLSRYGIENTEFLCEWNNKKKPVTIRVNKSKKDYKDFIRYLKQEKFLLQTNDIIPYMFQVNNASLLFDSPWFENGFFSVQSISSALAVLELNPQPGETVIDLCAAPGGKTTFMAELMQGKGTITAIDINKNRLNLLRTNLKRLKFSSVTIKCLDAAKIDHLNADKILVDVPCSGFGTLPQKPDIRWKRNLTDIFDLAKLQYQLLTSAAKIVNPKGTILYSTCTIEPEENEQIIEKFLRKNHNFELLPVEILKSDNDVLENRVLTVLPFAHNLDGSFIAKLRKIE